jgi:maleate cis-trans isomerase
MPHQEKTIGFISPPGWFDPSPAEFPTVCANDVRVQQCPLALPNFDWRIETIAGTEPSMMSAAGALGDAGCNLVAKVGTPFAWAGFDSMAEARARQDRLSAAAKVPAVMAGIAILDAFKALRAQRVALACTYYSDDWMAQWARFVGASGFEVIAAQNLAGQGLMVPHGDDDRDYWAPTAEQIIESVLRIARAAPRAEAIAVSGAGSRTLSLIATLEAETGRPVFGSDTALYWAVARTAEVELRPGILGRLTDA